MKAARTHDTKPERLLRSHLHRLGLRFRVQQRLLDEVSRDDRGQVVARTYLTSETGKVYTMLAHAAGRFDQ